MISRKDDLPQVALIGVSGYATVYVEWLLEAQRARRVDIVAISVLPSEQSLPVVEQLRELGAAVFDSYEQLFGDEGPRLDLCYIPTGIQWHARMAIAAMRSGCNVLVEKPLAGSVADAREVQKVERETGHWVAVGFQDMYTDEIAWLKKRLADGAIGKIEAVAMLGAWPRPESYYRRNQWAGRLKADSAQVLDSPFNNAFAHFLNLSLFLAGPTPGSSSKTTVQSANLYRAHDIESFDTAVVLARSETDVLFWFGASHACQISLEPSIRITGEKGHVEWSHESSCAIYVGEEMTESQAVPKYAVTRSEMFEAVLRRLKNPDTRICDTSIARCHTALIEQIHQSTRIRTISESAIERFPLDNAGATVPAIRGIESRLETAFATLAPVEDIECDPIRV